MSARRRVILKRRGGKTMSRNYCRPVRRQQTMSPLRARRHRTSFRFPILARVCLTSGPSETAVTTRCRRSGCTSRRKGWTSWLATRLGKATTDAGDSLSGGGVGGYRAPGIVPISFDTALASFNVTHSFVGSGTYELPLGSGKQFLGNMNRASDLIFGGWSVNSILSFDSGQPQTIGSQISTGSGTRRVCGRGSGSEPISRRNPALLQSRRIQGSAGGRERRAIRSLSSGRSQHAGERPWV